VAITPGTGHHPRVIGHPVARAWYARHHAPKGRVSLGDGDVRHLLGQIGRGSPVTDLGGEDSLNLLIHESQLVLRVHKPPIKGPRLVAEHRLRNELAAQGLQMPVPVTWDGRSIFRCGPRWAELEQYLALTWAPPGRATNQWHFNAIGQLHRALTAVTPRLSAPLTRTWAAPMTLRRWLRLNTVAGVASLQDPLIVADLADLTRRLQQRWIPAQRLPTQLIHGDLHRGNVMRGSHGGAVYLDLTGIAPGPRIHDLAYAIADLAARPSNDPAVAADSFTWAELPILIRAYEQGAGWTLNSVEREALPAYIAAVPLFLDICDWSDRPRRATARWVLEHEISI
jgi:Ser/Thr protein kinase RdoA (MazF antagonist)